MAAIVAVPDPELPAIRVDLTGFPDGPIVVTGSSSSGASWRVRSIEAVSGGVISGYDYEVPLAVAMDMQEVTYSASAGTTLVTSAATVLRVDECRAMLRVPGRPALDVTVEVVRKPQAKYPREQVVLRPIGRRTGVPLTGALSAGEFDLIVRTRTETAAVALESLLAAAQTGLLLLPGTRWRRTYVSLGAVSGDTVETYRPADIEDETDSGGWDLWTIACVVVDRPEGGMFGDPRTSYQAGVDAFASYDAAKTAQPAYLDRLKA